MADDEQRILNDHKIPLRNPGNLPPISQPLPLLERNLIHDRRSFRHRVLLLLAHRLEVWRH